MDGEVLADLVYQIIQDFDGCTFLLENTKFTDALRSALVTSGVLVKTCIASTKVYIKLESLIMAQNERWRQA